MRLLRASAVALLAGFVAWSAPAPAAETPAAPPRILVLGFAPGMIDDLQDRLLRETLLREFVGRGFPIVPVMQIESLFQDEPAGKIRRLKRNEVRAHCHDTGARFAIAGIIAPRRADRKGTLKKGETYDCTMTLYNRDKDSFLSIELAVTGRDTLLDTFKDLAAAMADAATPHLGR